VRRTAVRGLLGPGALALAGRPGAQACEYWVAPPPPGSDANPGTAALFQHGFDLVR
jgi:hypothetical protein